MKTNKIEALGKSQKNNTQKMVQRHNLCLLLSNQRLMITNSPSILRLVKELSNVDLMAGILLPFSQAEELKKPEYIDHNYKSTDLS